MVQTQAISEVAADSREKALRALVTAQTFLEAASREIPGIADHIRRGDHQSVTADLKLLLDGLESLAYLAISLEEVLPDQTPDAGRLDLGAMKTDLEALVGSQERGDWPEVARVIEGEIGPRVKPWQDHFRSRVELLRLSTSP